MECSSSIFTRRMHYNLLLNSMTKSSQIQISWDEYRRRRRWFFIVWLTYLPGAVLVAHLLQALLGSEHVSAVVVGLWMLAFAITGGRLGSFPCPRCHRPFFRRDLISNPLTGECLHCGFPKWGEIGPDELTGDEFHCFVCGSVIRQEHSKCESCGWMWTCPHQTQRPQRKHP